MENISGKMEGCMLESTSMTKNMDLGPIPGLMEENMQGSG